MSHPKTRAVGVLRKPSLTITSGGEVTVAVRHIAPEQIRGLELVPPDWSLGAGDHVCVSVTDNGAGSVIAMEVMRILNTLGVKPRRTIRIGLWSGEEQGLLGSRAYVGQHFGRRTDAGAVPNL